MVLELQAAFPSPKDFLDAYAREVKAGGLFLRAATVPPGTAVGPCAVVLTVGKEPPVRIAAQLASVVPGVGVAVMFPQGAPPELHSLATRLQTPAAPTEAPAPPGVESAGGPVSLSARLKELSQGEKIQFALSADRDTRLALMRDQTNKVLHLHLLKNPRLSLDEVLYAAKQPSLSVDALRLIAEHRDWSMNPGVCSALARNPQVPVPAVLKLLSRLPAADLKVLAKGGARAPIVQAARRLVNE